MYNMQPVKKLTSHDQSWNLMNSPIENDDPGPEFFFSCLTAAIGKKNFGVDRKQAGVFFSIAGRNRTKKNSGSSLDFDRTVHPISSRNHTSLYILLYSDPQGCEP